MKKILFVATVQSHIMNFHIPYLKYWQEKGYEVHVATKMDREKYSDLDVRAKGIIWNDIDFDRNPFSAKSFKSLKQLIKLMDLNKYELLHTHTPIASIISRVAAKITKIEDVVYTAHGFHFFKGAPLKNWLIYYPIEKIMARYTDKLITMNQEDFDVASSKFKTRKKGNVFKVNGVGIDLDKYHIDDEKNMEFKCELGLQPNDFVITVVAELIERKNHKQLLEAMKDVSKKHKNIKVLFVGDGVLYDNIKQEIISNGLENNIKMLGFRHDVEKILNITDVIGLFSYHEGLPKNILEAMVAGKPVICTDIRGNNDLIENGENGYLVGLNNISDTVNSIEKLYQDAELCNYMKVNNKEKILNYSINNVLESVDLIYRKNHEKRH